MTGDKLFDSGLQPERTVLAWHRTALSLGVGGLIALRLLPPVLGTWSLAAGLAGIALAGTVWTLAARRARQTRTALLGSAQPLPGAGLLLLVALAVAGGAVLSILYVAGSASQNLWPTASGPVAGAHQSWNAANPVTESVKNPGPAGDIRANRPDGHIAAGDTWTVSTPAPTTSPTRARRPVSPGAACSKAPSTLTPRSPQPCDCSTPGKPA